MDYLFHYLKVIGVSALFYYFIFLVGLIPLMGDKTSDMKMNLISVIVIIPIVFFVSYLFRKKQAESANIKLQNPDQHKINTQVSWLNLVALVLVYFSYAIPPQIRNEGLRMNLEGANLSDVYFIFTLPVMFLGLIAVLTSNKKYKSTSDKSYRSGSIYSLVIWGILLLAIYLYFRP